ncbi:uncharacterized protein V1516DRAFT_671435 [Lipomyces oligophaga]|uniref:uncharacterized protein n=1 Tax=Lipomyces oligophaga TaxID=45792 RepID=UPI0034CFEE28
MYAPVTARTAVRAASRQFAARELLFKRSFQTSQAVKSPHFPEGPYNNLPFKVHNRKIPFAVPFTLFFTVPFLFPFFMAYLALNK